MMLVLASDGLAPWGQAAAIILALYVFVSILVSLVLVAALMFGFAWIREKSELLRQLRPQITQLNRAAHAAKRGEPLPAKVADNKVMSALVQVPRVAENVAARASSIEQSVDRGSTRVAGAVIEFHARTAMVKGMARAFFLPGLTKARPVAQEQEREMEPAAAVQAHDEEPPMEQEIIITQSFR
jgi:hypothetical protein